MNNTPESVVKKVLQKVRWIRYHRLHKVEAEALLKSIESEKGKISQHLKKRAKEYAHDVLGWTGYAPWLNVYAAVAGEFKEGWMPDNYYGWVVVPKMKGLYGEIAKANSLSAKLLNTDRLPDIAYHVNGLFFSPAWEVLPPETVAKYIFKHDDNVVYKADNSLQGKGIHFLDKGTFDIEKIGKTGNGVFQKYIKQHDFFDELMPNSAVTLRLTSVVEDDGNVSCRAAYLRIGRNKDTHVKSATAIKVPVDLKSGKLYEKGYLTDWRSIERHPDTNTLFAGKEIPKFHECVAYVTKTHHSVPYCRSVGWDLVVDKNETIQLMEWNGTHNDIKFSEATHGPCFADLGWEKLWRI
ncbi:MAG: hypothetical protein FWG84_01365 [Bacteroidales bacterium]|nr:hypothetical protein [Bacteroidales bacterium]